MTKLLIDADLLLYKSCSAVEVDVRWDEENHVLFSNSREAFDLFQNQIEKLKTDLKSDDLVLAFTKGQSFRTTLYPPYKAPRQTTRKPLAFARVREMAEAKYETYSHPGLEADDVLGIWATSGKFKDAIVVSEDKDLKTIPCKLWRQNELLEVTEEEADYNFMFQTLTGDVTDGYPGCPGVGPKTAEKILALTTPELPVWGLVVGAYVRAGLDEEDALTQARMARILRASDWDSNKKEPILWHPNITA